MWMRAIARWMRKWLSPRGPLTAGGVLRAALATMRRKRYCLLATATESGVDARVVQPFAPDPSSLAVLFGTSPRSRKARQIAETGRATLVYEDDAKDACVSLSGRATLVDDPAQLRAHFASLFWAFFPDGPEGGDYVLVRLEPERVEVIDFSRRVTPEPFGLRSAVLERREGAWELVG